MKTIDLNCDMGEGFGAYSAGNDEAILPYITSANIACGFHAGDAAAMRRTVRLALRHNVSIGAHPGLQDLHGFGRRSMAVTPDEVYELMVYQIGALWGFARAEGTFIRHVKPHGALYNMAAQNHRLAEAVAEAIYRIDPGMILFGLAGSELIAAGEKLGLATASEVFADRTYQSDGSLTPRTQADALITNVEEAARQVICMVKEGKVMSQQRCDVHIQADTVCIHGDGMHAPAFAATIAQALAQEGIRLQAVGRTFEQ
ncbi:LamB/YcsF family protein [Paenibacillaceae bacterium]|nr:LamB/YcsF family protein [Paenibacillaceae bacterium]